MKTTTFQVIFVSLMTFTLSAQSAYDFTQVNRAVMRHFNGEQLQSMMDTEPERLELVTRYFNQSFQVEVYNCSQCEVDFKNLFDISLFNISDFEDQRLDEQEISIAYKDEYLITLLSKSDMSTLLNGQTPFELIYGLPERPFPTWESLANDQVDFENYKAELLTWSNDFPKQYREKKKSPNVLKVRFVQFTEMTNAERNAVFTFPGGYIIADDEIMNF